MPKFQKGSQEAKDYMRMLRERRGINPNPNNKQHITRDKVQEIVKEAIDKYFLTGTAKIKVPDKVVKIDKKGHPHLVDTLTKSGNLKKVEGEKVISIESNPDINNIVIADSGTKLKDKTRALNQEILKGKMEKKTTEFKQLDDELKLLEQQLKQTRKKNEREELKKNIEIVKLKKNELASNREYSDPYYNIEKEKADEVKQLVNDYQKTLTRKKAIQ